MPIKHVPVCPFCNAELNKMPTPVKSSGVRLVLSFKNQAVLESDHRSKSIFEVDDYWTVDAWKCETCNFIALFKGEP